MDCVSRALAKFEPEWYAGVQNEGQREMEEPSDEYQFEKRCNANPNRAESYICNLKTDISMTALALSMVWRQRG
jgi:hypothetical protein